ncbi:DUF222 domain-containing protein [Nocardioides humilatus]|uniref:DUF222 domain-containing protein n=1 Tax=Nocardioides humilatus TaxID=2607660 RepID=A0A5B1L4W6_9ACTN|nr:HNH endonuclease signature motif containing protein [Nocardioides humilatus]KAA1415486.1 DUF222 domain-containing protein [Nocardioides humilatus]
MNRTTTQLLDDLATGVGLRRRVEVEEFSNLIAWADANVVDDPEGAATIRDSYIDTGIPIAGPGAPLVSEFALQELCATLERSLDSGRIYVGNVIETGWRLPTITQAVLAGKVPVWKALKVAERTRSLSPEAAAFVDRHLGFALAGCTWAQVDRVVSEAIDRYDPDAAEERRQDAADRRHCTVDLDDATTDGVVGQSSVLDLADALALEEAVARRAEELRLSGCEESLDVRRSMALGEIARGDLSLDLQIVDPDTGEITKTIPGKKLELFVHITAAALAAVGNTGDRNVGRLGNTQKPVLVDQIRQWAAVGGAQIVVRPVIDPNGHAPVDSYEIPDRLRRVVEQRDHHCRAPHCTRRAERCDLDHAHPHGKGGPTCPCNLVPLCRRHHRAKTFEFWVYEILEPGLYLWTSRNGRRFIVGPQGTHALDPTVPRYPADDEPPWAHPGLPEPD